MLTVEETWGGVRYLVTHHANPQTIYDELNREFWGGRLPRYRVVFESDDHPLPDSDDGFVLGACDHDTQTIVVHALSETRPGGLRRIVAHEMCHVALPDDGHGEAFQRELARVMR